MTSFLGALPTFSSSDENTAQGVSDIGSRTVQQLGDIMGFENQIHVQPILENIEYSKSLATQAASLLKGNHISQENYDEIILEGIRYRRVGQESIQGLNALYPKLKTSLAEAVNSIGQGVASGPRMGVAEAKKAASAARSTAAKALKTATDELAQLQTSVTSLEIFLKTNLAKVTTGLSELNTLVANGATTSEVAAATAQLTRDQFTYEFSVSNMNSYVKGLDAATFTMDQVVAKSSQTIVQADLALESAKVYEGGNAVASGGVRLIARAVGAYTDPMKKMAFRLKRKPRRSGTN